MAANSDQSDSDDLEYHIAFPAPKPETQEDYVEFKDKVVVLLGWLDSKDKYLAVYSKVYEQKGFTTLRYSPLKSDIVGTRKQVVARKLLDILVDLSLADGPILFHVFSNGGSLIYQEMRREILRTDDYSDIAKLGLIYDSAPGRLSLLTGFRVYVFKSQDSFWQRLVHGLGIVFQWLASFLPFESSSGKSGYGGVHDEVSSAPAECPELFLYGSADELISATDVELAIASRKSKGVEVTSKCWQDSPHVQHLRLHRDEYVEQCLSFVRNCLKKSQ